MAPGKLSTILTLTAALVVARAAYAQDEAIVNKMVELNKTALADFEAKNFEAAKDALLEAIVVGKEAGLANHKMMARTYLHLGAVYIDGLKDHARGVRYLGLALKIRSDIQITPSLVTPALNAAFDEAKKGGAEAAPPPPPPEPKPAPPPPKPEPVAPRPAPPPEPKPAPPPPLVETRSKEPEPAPKPKKQAKAGPEEPDLPANIPKELFCPNPDEAPPKEQIALRCVAKPGVQVARVLLFYRAPGGERFTAVPTVRSPKGWFNGVIPGSVVSGKTLQYYFEARDPSDKIAGHEGRSDSPNQIYIREGAPPVGKGALAVLRFQKASGDGDVKIGEENPLEAIEREKERVAEEAIVHRRRPRSLFLGVAMGSGYGWHPAGKLEFRPDLAVGAGPSSSGLFHVAPEIGYQWSEELAVSLQGRFQYIPQQGSGDLHHPGDPASGATAVLLKGSYFMTFNNVQTYFQGVIGAGDAFRLVIPPRPTMNPMTDLPRNDTVRGGPVALGPGAGFMYHFTPHIQYMLEVKALVGVPTVAAVVDFATGVQVTF